jgi:hypothetical protein
MTYWDMRECGMRGVEHVVRIEERRVSHRDWVDKPWERGHLENSRRSLDMIFK